MPSLKIILALVVPGAVGAQTATAQTRFGAQGAEGDLVAGKHGWCGCRW